jgi:hypothetical protein
MLASSLSCRVIALRIAMLLKSLRLESGLLTLTPGREAVEQHPCWLMASLILHLLQCRPELADIEMAQIKTLAHKPSPRIRHTRSGSHSNRVSPLEGHGHTSALCRQSGGATLAQLAKALVQTMINNHNATMMIDGRKRAARAFQIIPYMLQHTKKQLQALIPAFVYTSYLDTCRSHPQLATLSGLFRISPDTLNSALASFSVFFALSTRDCSIAQVRSGPAVLAKAHFYCWSITCAARGRKARSPPLATVMQRFSIAL